MAGAPGLDALCGDSIALRQYVQRLVNIEHLKILFDAAADGGAEIRFHLRLDDKGHAAEAGAPCVEKGKVDNNMALRIHRGDLLGAAKTAAHTGCENNKGRFLHDIPPFCRPVKAAQF